MSSALTKRKSALIFGTALLTLFSIIIIALAADMNYGTASEFEASSTERMSGVDINTDKFVVCYEEGSDGECRVGSVSGTTITWGTEAAFDTGDISKDAWSITDTCKLTDDKFAVVYVKDDSGDDGYTVIGSVSGTTITFGSSVEFETGDMEWGGCAGIDTDKWAIGYNDEGDSNTGKGVICTASGTTASCGTPVDYDSTDHFPKYNAVEKIGTDKFLVAFEGEDDNDGYAYAATVSGTTPTFGSSAAFTTDNPKYVDVCSPDDDDEFVIVYQNNTDTTGEAIAGTVSGTTITYGSAATFNPDDTVFPGCTFTDDTHFVVAYEDVGNSQYGTSAYCEVNWTTRAITCNSEETFFSDTEGSGDDGGRGIGTISGYGGNPKLFIGYIEDANGDDGMAIIGDVADTTAPSAVTDLALSDASDSAMTVSWTAPGDDGSTGTATTYDVRYSTSTITEGNWSSATQVSGEPTPSVADTSESMNVTSLASTTTYYFALKTSDEVPNESGISNVPSLATTETPDTTAPAAVTDLTISDTHETSVDLTWTAPGDDGSTGTAETYDLRYSKDVITESNWGSASQASGEPSPKVAGSSESFTIVNLDAGDAYHFALKTSDEASNQSGISNVPGKATTAARSGEGTQFQSTKASFQGMAYPNSAIELFRRNRLDPPDMNVILATSSVGSDGNFIIALKELIFGDYLFALRAIDKDGEDSGIVGFNVDFLFGEKSLAVDKIIVPPTINLAKSIITRGSNLEISGYASPNSMVELSIGDKITIEIKPDAIGRYTFSTSTVYLDLGTHYVKGKQTDQSGIESAFSSPKTFKLSPLTNPRADFNNDYTINVTDWSIFLSNWGSENETQRLKTDMDSSGKVDITDFSIFLRAMRI